MQPATVHNLVVPDAIVRSALGAPTTQPDDRFRPDAIILNAWHDAIIGHAEAQGLILVGRPGMIAVVDPPEIRAVVDRATASGLIKGQPAPRGTDPAEIAALAATIGAAATGAAKASPSPLIDRAARLAAGAGGLGLVGGLAKAGYDALRRNPLTSRRQLMQAAGGAAAAGGAILCGAGEAGAAYCCTCATYSYYCRSGYAGGYYPTGQIVRREDCYYYSTYYGTCTQYCTSYYSAWCDIPDCGCNACCCVCGNPTM